MVPKYLGVIINSKLKWKDHCEYVVNKATICLNRLHCAMYDCTPAAKISAYKVLVRPYLEYACAVWSPFTIHDNTLLESLQNRAACLIRSFEMDLPKNGPSLLLFVLMKWDGPYLKPVEATYLSGLYQDSRYESRGQVKQ